MRRTLANRLKWILPVRRESFWFQRLRNLSEYLAHLVTVLCGDLTVLQASRFECFAFDPFSFV